MRVSAVVALVAISVTIAGAQGVAAQDAGAGYTGYGFNLFQENCAVCHGSMGHGDGPVADLFAQRPRDLSLLSSENDGVFPFDAVAASIDGRQMVRSHGSEMPIWGDALSVEAQEMILPNRATAEEVVHGRILALTYFLQSVQQ